MFRRSMTRGGRKSGESDGNTPDAINATQSMEAIPPGSEKNKRPHGNAPAKNESGKTDKRSESIADLSVSAKTPDNKQTRENDRSGRPSEEIKIAMTTRDTRNQHMGASLAAAKTHMRKQSHINAYRGKEATGGMNSCDDGPRSTAAAKVPTQTRGNQHQQDKMTQSPERDNFHETFEHYGTDEIIPIIGKKMMDKPPKERAMTKVQQYEQLKMTSTVEHVSPPKDSSPQRVKPCDQLPLQLSHRDGYQDLIPLDLSSYHSHVPGASSEVIPLDATHVESYVSHSSNGKYPGNTSFNYPSFRHETFSSNPSAPRSSQHALSQSHRTPLPNPNETDLSSRNEDLDVRVSHTATKHELYSSQRRDPRRPHGPGPSHQLPWDRTALHNSHENNRNTNRYMVNPSERTGSRSGQRTNHGPSQHPSFKYQQQPADNQIQLPLARRYSKNYGQNTKDRENIVQLQAQRENDSREISKGQAELDFQKKEKKREKNERRREGKLQRAVLATIKQMQAESTITSTSTLPLSSSSSSVIASPQFNLSSTPISAAQISIPPVAGPPFCPSAAAPPYFQPAVAPPYFQHAAAPTYFQPAAPPPPLPMQYPASYYPYNTYWRP